MKHMSYLFLILALLCMLLFSACGKYRPDDFLGKSSVQIEADYGAFDCTLMPADPDGLYRNCRCGYTVPGANPEVLLFIFFDENGVAIKCEEGYRPGG